MLASAEWWTFGVACVAAVGSLAAAFATYVLARETSDTVKLAKVNADAAKVMAGEAAAAGARDRKDREEVQARLVRVWQVTNITVVSGGYEAIVRWENKSDDPVTQMSIEAFPPRPTLVDIPTRDPVWLGVVERGATNTVTVGWDIVEGAREFQPDERVRLDVRFYDNTGRGWNLAGGKLYRLDDDGNPIVPDDDEG